MLQTKWLTVINFARTIIFLSFLSEKKNINRVVWIIVTLRYHLMPIEMAFGICSHCNKFSICCILFYFFFFLFSFCFMNDNAIFFNCYYRLIGMVSEWNEEKKTHNTQDNSFAQKNEKQQITVCGWFWMVPCRVLNDIYQNGIIIIIIWNVSIQAWIVDLFSFLFFFLYYLKNSRFRSHCVYVCAIWMMRRLKLWCICVFNEHSVCTALWCRRVKKKRSERNIFFTFLFFFYWIEMSEYYLFIIFFILLFRRLSSTYKRFQRGR